MKVKSILKFLLILILILALYFVFILNIDYITISYHGKLEEYNNIYYKEAEELNILIQIKELEESYERIPDEAIEVIKNSKMIKRILNKANTIEENEIVTYIEYLKGEDKINLVRDNIIYINEENYELAFTLDMNNIVYQRIIENNREIEWDSREITIQNKYEIYEKVSEKLQELGITEKFDFEPETLYFKYAVAKEIDSDVYGIEDNKNHIKIVVSGVNCEIENLQIGFTENLL